MKCRTKRVQSSPSWVGVHANATLKSRARPANPFRKHKRLGCQNQGHQNPGLSTPQNCPARPCLQCFQHANNEGRLSHRRRVAPWLRVASPSISVALVPHKFLPLIFHLNWLYPYWVCVIWFWHVYIIYHNICMCIKPFHILYNYAYTCSVCLQVCPYFHFHGFTPSTKPKKKRRDIGLTKSWAKRTIFFAAFFFWLLAADAPAPQNVEFQLEVYRV